LENGVKLSLFNKELWGSRKVHRKLLVDQRSSFYLQLPTSSRIHANCSVQTLWSRTRNSSANAKPNVHEWKSYFGKVSVTAV